MGLAFLQKAEELGAPVDCVVLDYQMPDMNGEAVVKALRSIPGISSIPVILLTSVDQTNYGRLVVEFGIDAYLTKPARSSLLLETLVDVLQKSGSAGSVVDVSPQYPEMPAAPEDKAAALTQEPVSPVEPLCHDEPDQPLAAADGGGQLDILVAEDNEVNQLVFSQILNGMRLNYLIAGNGREAVEAWRERSPALILMDVSMPEMNGLDATRAIREAEQSGSHHTPIIGVTAHALNGDRERCVAAGMDDYMSKPVSPDKLVAKTKKWLGEIRATAGSVSGAA